MPRDVFFIGGSPCSGKSSMAEQLCQSHGLAYYKLDDYLEAHMAQAAAEGKPHSKAALALDFEQMWMRDPQLQCREELAIYEEILPYALRDIAAMGTEASVITEGAGYLPALLAGRQVPQNRYACVVPTEAFQREHYAKRPWISQFLAGCQKPEVAFDNWMRRDALFAQAVLQQAKVAGYAHLLVDGSTSLAENYRWVAGVFGLLDKETVGE